MPLRQRNATARPAVNWDLLPPPFRCISSQEGARTVRVDACGEIDLLTAPELERALREATTNSRVTVLDVHDLTFIDSSGVHVIEDAGLRASSQGRRLIVSRASGHLRRILVLTGTSAAIELVDVDPPSGPRLVA